MGEDPVSGPESEWGRDVFRGSQASKNRVNGINPQALTRDPVRRLPVSGWLKIGLLLRCGSNFKLGRTVHDNIVPGGCSPPAPGEKRGLSGTLNRGHGQEAGPSPVDSVHECCRSIASRVPRVIGWLPSKAASPGEMAELISKHHGLPQLAPAMAEAPLEQNVGAIRFGERLLQGEVAVAVFMTGVGTRTLLEVLRTRYRQRDLLGALARNHADRSRSQADRSPEGGGVVHGHSRARAQYLAGTSGGHGYQRTLPQSLRIDRGRSRVWDAQSTVSGRTQETGSRGAPGARLSVDPSLRHRSPLPGHRRSDRRNLPGRPVYQFHASVSPLPSSGPAAKGRCPAPRPRRHRYRFRRAQLQPGAPPRAGAGGRGSRPAQHGPVGRGGLRESGRDAEGQGSLAIFPGGRSGGDGVGNACPADLPASWTAVSS